MKISLQIKPKPHGVCCSLTQARAGKNRAGFGVYLHPLRGSRSGSGRTSPVPRRSQPCPCPWDAWGGGVGDRVFPTYLGGWRDPTGAGSSRLPGQLRSLHPKKPSEAGDEGTRCKAAAAGTGGGYAGSSGKSKDGAGSDRGVRRAGATALLEPVPAPAIEGRS